MTENNNCSFIIYDEDFYMCFFKPECKKQKVCSLKSNFIDLIKNIFNKTEQSFF